MKKYFNIYFILTFGIFTNLFAQSDIYFEGSFTFRGDTGIVVHDFIELNDSIYVGVGFIIDTIYTQSPYVPASCFIFGISCSGKLLWSKLIHKELNANRASPVITLKSITDSTFYLITNAYGRAGGIGFLSYVISSNGEVLIKKMIPQSDIFQLNDAITLKDKYICLTGITYSQGVVCQFATLMDVSHKIIWNKSFIGERVSTVYDKDFPDIQMNEEEILIAVKPKNAIMAVLSLNIDGEVNFYNQYNVVNPVEQIPKYCYFGLGDDYNLVLYPDFRRDTPSPGTFQMGHQISGFKIDKENGSLLQSQRFYYDSISTGGANIKGFERNIDVTFIPKSKEWHINVIDIHDEIVYRGAPTFIKLNDSLDVIYAKNIGENGYKSRDGAGFNNDSLYSTFYFHMSDSTFNGPYGRYPHTRNTFSFWKEGFMFGKRPIEEMPCNIIKDITDNWTYEKLDLQVIKLNESIGEGPIFVESTFQEIDIHPVYSTVCMDKGELVATIDLLDTVLCLNDTVLALSSTNNFVNGWTWHIDDSLISRNKSTQIIMNKSGEYQLKLVVSDGCFKDTAFQTITVLPMDSTYFDTILCLGDTIIFLDSIIIEEGLYTFEYQNANGCNSYIEMSITEAGSSGIVDTILCTGQIFTLENLEITQDTTIDISLIDEFGCDSIVKTNIIFDDECDCPISIPYAFTPNGDQLNDDFHLINECNLEIISYHSQIYTRWGVLVFESTDGDKIWDGSFEGEDALSEVYLVNIQLELSNGSRYHFVQDLTLVR